MADPSVANSTGRRTLLVLSQVYVPDPASVGQHMADAASEMARRGWRVVVLTANRGYENPSVKYPARETIEGVDVRRLPFSSFGKKSIPIRLLAGTLFMLQSILRGLFTRRLGAILVSTSPPMCSVAALVISTLRRAPIKYWVMDMNPDQMIQIGKITEKSLSARLFNWFNRLILRRAADVVTLDRFMAERLNRKIEVGPKLAVMPPWPHEAHLDVVDHDRNPFRAFRNLDGKFVIMYSGNHGLTTPVTTILQAALRMQDDPNLVFMFIGGGHGKKEVEQVIRDHKPANIRSLPYQPIEELRFSLSAADVHLVTMGDDVVGVIHPCKIYGAMKIQRPILLVGPDPCHATDLINEAKCGWRIAHGDVDGAVQLIRRIMRTPKDELVTMGRRGSSLIDRKYSMAILRKSFCDVVDRT